MKASEFDRLQEQAVKIRSKMRNLDPLSDAYFDAERSLLGIFTMQMGEA